jgi:hypothetical protein
VAAPAAEPDESSNGGAAALAADWFRAYAKYVKSAAGHSASTIDLYQQITDRVVRQELELTATQEMLTAFVQDRGSTYSDELSALNARFFSELVRVSTTFGHDLGRMTVPEGLAGFVPPPVFDPADPAGWFQALGDYGQQLSASIASAYSAVRDGANDAAPADVQAIAAEYLQRRLPQYVGEISKLYFELLNGLTELRVRSEQEFLSGVLAAASGDAAETAFELVLEAPVGEEARASLSIGNTRDEPAAIQATVSDVRRGDGIGPAFVADLVVTPKVLELAPGEEGRFMLSLRIDAERYEPGIAYVGALQILGHGEPRLEVPLRITGRPRA